MINNKLIALIAFVLPFFSYPLHAVTTTSPGFAATSGAIIAANMNRINQERNNDSRLLHQKARKKHTNSVGVIICVAYYKSINSGYIFEGCNVGGTFDNTFMSFDSYIEKHAPGFELDYFVLDYHQTMFELYVKEKGKYMNEFEKASKILLMEIHNKQQDDIAKEGGIPLPRFKTMEDFEDFLNKKEGFFPETECNKAHLPDINFNLMGKHKVKDD